MKCNTTIRFLRDIADIQTGPFGSQLHKEDYVEYGTPIVTVEHLGNRQFTEQNLPKVSDSDKERLKKYVLATGDIVFSRVGSVDRCSYVDEEHNGWMFSGRCLRVRPSEYIHPLYLYYYFCREETRQFVRNIAVGATMPSINTKLLGEVPIAVPDMKIQKTVSNILSTIDDKIELNNKINANLQQQAQAIFKSWFVDFEPFQDGEFVESELGPIPKGWRVGSVADIVNIHDSKRIPLSGAQRQRMEKKIYPYYGAASLMDYVENYIFDGIYLLLGEDGTVMDDKGYPILQYVWGKFWVNNHAHVLTGKCGYSVESLYLLFLNTPVKSIVTGAVQAKISQSNLKAIQVIVPSQEVLDKFNELIQPYFSMIRQKGEENKRLENLRDALLPKLMNGEIDIIKD